MLYGHSDRPFSVLFLKTRNFIQNSHYAIIIYLMNSIYASSISPVIVDICNLMIYANKSI